MASNGLTAQPLGQEGGFNGLFLVDLIVCGILALFFIFYFNRTVSTIISYAIRAWTWHKYRAYIDITSFQISPLGGRLFFKSIRYHGQNQTVFVHDGHITWRYWLRQVQDPLIVQKLHQRHNAAESDHASSDGSHEKTRPRSKSMGKAEAAGGDRQKNLPCRILVKVSGVEAFLYNQSPVYDNIINNLQNKARTKDPSYPSANVSSDETTKEVPSADDLNRQDTPSSNGESLLAETASRTTTRTTTHESAIPAFLRIFPIQIECKKAAAAVGNDFSQSILTAKLENASGRIDADESGALDLYKLLFNFDFHDINVALKPNTDYQMSQMQAAARLDKDEDPKAKKGRGLFGLHPIRRMGKISRAIAHALKWLFTWHRSSKRSIRTASLLSDDEILDNDSSKLPGEAQWQGLARYLDETGNEHNEWDDVEYARFSNVADVKKASMTFYWDVPGKVSQSQITGQSGLFDEMNGPVAPEYGLNLSVDGATVHYGPWADRQRMTLQNIFFPTSYHDAVPAQRLAVDQNRVATVFKLFFCLESEITLRIPTREASKDWKWQGRAEGHRTQKTTDAGVRKRRGKGTKKWFKKEPQTTGADIRPFGWMDVKVAADTTINYAMDMYARQDGYHNSLSLDVKGTEISSSVNHAMLWKAGNLLLEGDLSNPLRWNALRKWVFKIHCDGLDLYILRDHLFLLTDLIADWGMGPPPDFYTFVPFVYSLDINFKNFKLFLNANDANIVNDPSDLEDNNFLVLDGEKLHATLEIPLDQYRPAQNSIKFDVLAKDLSLDISNPPRITLHSLLRQKRLATLKKLTLGGSHTFFVEQSPGLTDMLQMDICGTDLNLQAFGYLVRMFVNVKENYFGEFLHFKTLEEYQNAGSDAANAEINMVGRFAFRPANDLDVVLCITAEHPVILLPANLYSAETYIKVELPIASMDLRVANYYLDLAVDVSPVSVSWSGMLNDEDTFDDSSPQIILDSAMVTGHRLFGLPPTEPAYVSNWDVSLGNVSGECSLDFMKHLAKAGRAVAFALDDFENALPLAQTAEIPEAVFLRLKTGSICLWLNEGKSAIRLCSDPITLNQNDRADSLFSSRLHLHIPNITATCVESDSMAHRGSRADVKPASCIAYLQTSLDMTMVQRKAHFSAEREKQQDHIRRQDARTSRARFLITDYGDQAGQNQLEAHTDGGNTFTDTPSMRLPNLPDPLRRGPPELEFAADGSIESSISSSSSVNPIPTQKALPEGDLDDVQQARPSMYYSKSETAQPLGTVGLWSPFSVPDPQSLDVDADLSKVPQFSTIVDEADDLSETSSQSDWSINLDPDGNLDQQTFLIRMIPGIRIYVEPRISETIVNIVTALQPTRSEDVIDTFQMDVMGRVQQVQDQKKSRRGITELNLVVPSIDAKLFNDQKLDTSRTTAVPVQDQLDVGLSHLNMTLRTKPIPDTETGSAVTMHLTLDSALAKFSNPLEKITKSDYAIRLGFDDVLIWMVLSKSKSVHVSFKDLLGVISGNQADYLASVFSRYAAIGTKIQKQADAVEIGAKARLRNLTDYLTEHADVSTDPPYLSRMTYVLRAFPDHFRNQESWKIVARFRHIYECLSDESRVALEQQLSDGTDSLKKTSSILETWAAWCSWDIPNVEQTQVFKLLLGDIEAKIPEEDIEPLDLTLRAGVVRIAVESEKSSSEVSLGTLSIGVTVIPPSLPSGLMLVEENLRSKTVFQAHTAASVLRLNWDILEQADAFIDIYFEQVSHTLDTLPEPVEKQALDELSFRQDFHVVLSTDEGSIELKTVNLRHVSTCNNLKMSLIGSDKASQDYGECISLLISARKAFTELHGPEQRIWRTDLVSPSIYIDVKKTIREYTTAVNVGGSYEQLHISLEQETLGLLEVVDQLLVDEVAYIQRFQKHVQKEQEKSVATKGPPKPERELKLNVAFLAGSFSLNVALLKALNLSVRGDTANLRVRPMSGSNPAWSIELHLGTMEQALIRKEDGSKRQRAVFNTPPASSTLNLEFTEEKVNINFTGIMEEVLLEASAVQSVLTIMNRPEVQDVLEAIRDQVSDLRQRVTKTLAKDEKPAKAVAEQSRVIIYDVNTTLAGFKIVALAPVLTAGKARAELTLGVGAVQAAVTNKTRQASDAFPDIHGKIQDIGAVLTLIEDGKRRPCGHVTVSVAVDCCTQEPVSGPITRDIKARSESFDVFLYADTASTIVDIVTHVHRKILDLDLSREVEYLRRLRHSRDKRRKYLPPPAPGSIKEEEEESVTEVPSTRPALLDFSLDLRKIRIIWVVIRNRSTAGDQKPQDLEVSFSRIHLAIQRQNEARLSIQDLQVQVVPKHHKAFERSENSALLPEVVFTVRYESGKDGVRIACQAAGQALDIRLDSKFVVPVSMLQKSISAAVDQYRAAKLSWQTDTTPMDSKSTPRASPFGDKRLASVQADVNFKGALFYIQGDAPTQSSTPLRPAHVDLPYKRNRANSHASQDNIATSLRAPGIAIKVEYSNLPDKEQILNGEIKVDGSSNTVYPELVPIILQITHGIKEVVRHGEEERKTPSTPKIAEEQALKLQRLQEDDSLLTTDPSQFIGQMKLNLGLRICKQEFGLSCQPLARVNAKAQIEDIYITMSTINSHHFGHFFALSATVTKLGASVQHVYSRESTFSFDMESISMSLMNSRHLTGGSSGVSMVLKVSPTRTALNVRQIQDLLLFREIWFPPELRDTSAMSAEPSHQEPDKMVVQRYQQVSAAAAFPWNATVTVAELAVDLDLGQSIGKSSLCIKNLWASSKKSSTWKQDLCIGVDEVSINSTGRMSGFVELSDVSVRTSIEWPSADRQVHKAPLIQAAIGFGKISAKSALDYQPFAFADIEAFNFLMYNVRDGPHAPDRLKAILEGEKVYVFCTATSPAQAVGLYQAFDRLVQEKQTAYRQSMVDLDKQLRRRSVAQIQPEPKSGPPPHALIRRHTTERSKSKFPITLHTDVMVMLKSVCFGAFPSTFFDNQILKMEASEIQARFAVGLEDERVHSNLGMTLGQLQVALAQVKRVGVPKTLGDVSIDDVISSATGAKGGIILRVPKVIASMQTWQQPQDNNIDFIFKSLFEGKVDVGWNYSRISFIRGMWETHSRSLASRLGKPLPESAVKIRADEPENKLLTKDHITMTDGSSEQQQGKITAVVNMPQSRFEYTALEPPIIETPQLRDMGEATPPLEWIGLHRERLPNVTHQVVIVTLLEVAKEVEDAYERILGSS
ncbi:hypothetical protein E4T38_07776 [Aureobasidium subglaciale]|nr:hypothetical protein E4T38_07776 [Aureobasidium subglaciale]KAI5216791.1 hypothetical protein E4T40_07786 [Aureobasidium subglaciale]KAI5220027.1 hypothetical protein E4T41_07701 [Aureobasidium subglaciale]KAI5257857.1 hypothetical protein E4T46_07677 [Aureobasidium subglaciale]